MPLKDAQADFDVVIVGSGVAGALLADRLAAARLKVLILEAGDRAPQRSTIQENFVVSPTKTADSPFPDPIVAPQPRQATGGREYYDEDLSVPAPKIPSATSQPKSAAAPTAAATPPPNPPVPFKSYYERLVGGSTWHWQALNIRMLPNDFKLKQLYGCGFDWPITYEELEPWYCDAEDAMGTSGNTDEARDVYAKRFPGMVRSRPFPMPPLAPSYLDKWFARRLNGKRLKLTGEGESEADLVVTSVPHAINSQAFEGRPACDGRGTCVPFCPTRARYEAAIHVDRAVAAGAKLITKAMVHKLQAGKDRRITRVCYRDWNRDEHVVRGRIVVLAANGIENPKILLLSCDSNYPNGLANRSGAVGKYLMDHPIKSSFALAPEPVYPFRGPQTTADIGILRDGAFRSRRGAFKTSIKNDGWSGPTAAPRGGAFPVKNPDGTWAVTVPDEEWKPTGAKVNDAADMDDVGTLVTFVNQWNLFGKDLRTKLHDHAVRQITLNTHCEMLPIETNRVWISPDKVDRFGIPRPKIEFTVDDRTGYTREAFRSIVEFHKTIFYLLNATSVHLNADSDNAPLNFLGAGHLMGTTLMGSQPTTSVVDKDCRSHDHPNLFILGSSVFPTGSTANPTLTIAALALRAAKTILNEFRGR